jgi:hypothetical protein
MARAIHGRGRRISSKWSCLAERHLAVVWGIPYSRPLFPGARARVAVDQRASMRLRPASSVIPMTAQRIEDPKRWEVSRAVYLASDTGPGSSARRCGRRPAWRRASSTTACRAGRANSRLSGAQILGQNSRSPPFHSDLRSERKEAGHVHRPGARAVPPSPYDITSSWSDQFPWLRIDGLCGGVWSYSGPFHNDRDHRR